MKKIIWMAVVGLMAFSFVSAAFVPTPILEKKVEIAADALVSYVEKSLDGDFERFFATLEKFQLVVADDEEKSWLLWAVKAWVEMRIAEDEWAETMSETTWMSDQVNTSDVIIDVEGQNYSYSINTIEANIGDTVTINFINNWWTHDIVIDEFDVASEIISAWETTSVTFVVDQAWVFEYYCSIGNHREKGMEWRLFVEENPETDVVTHDWIVLENVVGAQVIRGVYFDGDEMWYGTLEYTDWKTQLMTSFADLPMSGSDNFYEGWIVRKSPLSVISTGRLTYENGVWVNNYTSEDDLSDHSFYVLTLEPEDDDPAPADHILEGDIN